MKMPRVDGVKLDPLVAAKDEAKPLISKLLAVPAFKERYLSYVRDIAEKHLDWAKLGPIAERYHKLIEPVVREGALIGITSSRNDRTASVIPSSFIKHCLDGRKNWKGLGYFAFVWQPVENPVLPT